MINSRFIKNMKSIWRRFKFWIFLVLVFLVFIPFVVFSFNTGPNFGYQSLKNGGSDTVVVFHNDVNGLRYGIGNCIKNLSGNSYFVPTKTQYEWDQFKLHIPASVSTALCCGDGVCSGVAGETCSTCPFDCSGCTCSHTRGNTSCAVNSGGIGVTCPCYPGDACISGTCYPDCSGDCYPSGTACADYTPKCTGGSYGSGWCTDLNGYPNAQTDCQSHGITCTWNLITYKTCP